MSAAFASNVLNGKKTPPKDRLAKLCDVLELDVFERESVVRSVMLDAFGSRVLSGAQRSRMEPHKIQTRKVLTCPTKAVLSHWANLAVLDVLTLEEPYSDIEDLRVRLQLSVAEMKRVLSVLEGAGLIQSENGRWRKLDDHAYIAAGRSRSEIRGFHDMMIAKARAELNTQTTDEAYHRRLINGFTLTVNPKNIEPLKAKIVRFMDELSREACADVCSDIYQLNVQFFPLTQKVKE